MFSGIKGISNLSTFLNLRSLRLDNNKITKIENLDHLVHLEWLGESRSCLQSWYPLCCRIVMGLLSDLSFNQISRIEGLTMLTNLIDLSLYSNNIEKIENLDFNTKLECLSLGRNNIAGYDGVGAHCLECAWLCNLCILNSNR